MLDCMARSLLVIDAASWAQIASLFVAGINAADADPHVAIDAARYCRAPAEFAVAIGRTADVDFVFADSKHKFPYCQNMTAIVISIAIEDSAIRSTMNAWVFML